MNSSKNEDNYKILSLVRCCFISPFTRAQIYAKNKSTSNESKDSFKEAPSIDYPVDGDAMIHIPGIVRYNKFIVYGIKAMQVVSMFFIFIENLHAKFFSNKILTEDPLQQWYLIVYLKYIKRYLMFVIKSEIFLCSRHQLIFVES